MIDKSILFVSQDLGSANALIPVIKNFFSKKGYQIEIVAEKQSINVFKGANFKVTELKGKGFEEALRERPDLVVTGASMLDSIEKKAILWAKKKTIKTLTILDYWGHYWHRFTVGGERELNVLPDLILIPDELAKKQMRTLGFPENKLKITGNPYFDSFITPREQINHPIKNILYISQPIYEKDVYFSDLGKISDVIQIIKGINPELEIILKPHPKENRDEFLSFESIVRVDWDGNIKDLLKNADLIIGTDSTVLFEAALSGKAVISYQPEMGRTDHLITNKLGLSFPAGSGSDLRKIIQKMIKNELKTKSISTMKYYNDGKCSSRVIKKIETLL